MLYYNAKGLQNGEKAGILKAGKGENMRSDRTRKDTAKHYAVALALLLFCSIVFYVQTHYQHTSAIRPEDDYQGRIAQFHSSVDRDDDGVDDQLDILNSALADVDIREQPQDYQDVLEKRTDIVGHYRISK